MAEPREILPMPDRAKIAMAMLRRAAEMNDVCPCNSLIATAIGARSPSKGSEIVSFLEVAGLIAVERGRTERVVTIVATGKRTRGEIKTPASYRRTKSGNGWNVARDAILMEAIANDLDFEQAGNLTGFSAEECAARFDDLCLRIGKQAA